ncbi:MULTISPECIES: hypothetical protein [unclassified Xanthobacter]|uniref:hypothetical protein n=1 Tax=unclassified Xanthobacter TaxID=2623496 RepID=UPI001F1EB429|nr:MULTISPECIES: hypothetical protein [unclassified Xanthobacter]
MPETDNTPCRAIYLGGLGDPRTRRLVERVVGVIAAAPAEGKEKALGTADTVQIYVEKDVELRGRILSRFLQANGINDARFAPQDDGNWPFIVFIEEAE